MSRMDHLKAMGRMMDSNRNNSHPTPRCSFDSDRRPSILEGEFFLKIEIERYRSLLSRCRGHLRACPDADQLVKEIKEVLR